MPKTTHVTTSAMPKGYGKESRHVTTAPVRKGPDVKGQAKKGLGKPHP